MKQNAGFKKRLLAALLCAVMALGIVAGAVAGTAYAAEIDTSREGGVTLRMDAAPSGYETAVNDLRSWLRDHPDEGLDIRLHRVASVDGGRKYALAEAFQSVPGLAGISSVGPDTKASDWEAFAEAAMAVAGGRTPEKSGTANYASLDAGFRMSGLALGIYLVEVRDFDAGDDVFSFVPFLAAVPGYGPGGGSLYDVEAGLKPQKADRTGSLVIRKLLPECRADSAGSTFVFEVLAEKGGKTVYNDVHSIVFTEHGSKEIRIDGIPSGAAVTVREVYSGSCYEAESSASQTVTIEADRTQTASFRNLYDDDVPRNGASAVNHITVGKDDSGTTSLAWEKFPASPSVTDAGFGK